MPREEQRREAMRRAAVEIFGADEASVGKWVDYWSRSKERNAALLESFLPLALIDFSGKRTLDIGCGAGGMAELIGSRCRLCAGGDYHHHILQFAPSAENSEFLQCSGTALPFAGETFDYVFAFDVIEHLVGGLDWQRRFLEEIRRVLAPTGMLLLTTPNRWHPYEGHTGLYFPQYLPLPLADRYIRWRNPGFLREHNSFAEIQLLTPAQLRLALRESGLAFLHDLPCGLDRRDYRRLFPLRGLLTWLGLGWYPHAEFWGVIVRREMRGKLRAKLRKNWHYEQQQPSPDSQGDFQRRIDFEKGGFGRQLGEGWYWHERDQRGFRWISSRAACWLQTPGGTPYLRLHGYSPRANHIEVWAEDLRVGEHRVEKGEEFRLQYLLPFDGRRPYLYEVEIRCREAFQPDDPHDHRDLGVMVFSVGLSEKLGS